jgi:hypothetical protein
MDMPIIQKCSVEDCAYNTDNTCHALAITVGDVVDPRCDTFYRTDHKGGVIDSTGKVGACKQELCKFNEDLECAASPGIRIAPQEGRAECITFEPR